MPTEPPAVFDGVIDGHGGLGSITASQPWSTSAKLTDVAVNCHLALIAVVRQGRPEFLVAWTVVPLSVSIAIQVDGLMRETVNDPGSSSVAATFQLSPRLALV